MNLSTLIFIILCAGLVLSTAHEVKVDSSSIGFVSEYLVLPVVPSALPNLTRGGGEALGIHSHQPLHIQRTQPAVRLPPCRGPPTSSRF